MTQPCLAGTQNKATRRYVFRPFAARREPRPAVFGFLLVLAVPLRLWLRVKRWLACAGSSGSIRGKRGGFAF